MCCASWSSRAMETGASRWVARARAAALVLIAAAASSAQAQTSTPIPAPVAPRIPFRYQRVLIPTCRPGAAVANLGSNFLERLGDQATSGFGRASRSNPGGGGGSEATEAPHFRTWGEAYGISTRTGPQADFVGDRRETQGGVAAFGARMAPGVNVGFSIDQSRTAIDVPLALQSATLDLTQLGFTAALQSHQGTVGVELRW